MEELERQLAKLEAARKDALSAEQRAEARHSPTLRSGIRLSTEAHVRLLRAVV